MKVLWFSNTSCNASVCLGEGPVGGGWLKSLDRALQGKVELHIAFYYPKTDKSFQYQLTTYHPISKGNWKLKAILGIFWGRIINREDLGKYLDIIQKVNPDVIHIHGTENAFGCIIPHVKIPVVVSIQGCPTVYHYKYLAGFSLRDLRISIIYRGNGLRQFIRNKSLHRSYKEFARLGKRERQNLRATKYIIGRTKWDQRISLVLAPDSIYYHGDELLRDAFHNYTWQNVECERLVVHTTTSNNTYKGFETLCEALYILRIEQGMDIIWQIAGLTEHDAIVKVTKLKLKRRFPQTGLIFQGPLDEDKLAHSLCKANIFVSPSHIENSPNSLCEAMLLGLPCIATFAGGTASLITDGYDGMLIQDGDPWALAGAILELYRDPHISKEYGHKARARALIRHDITRIVNTYLDIYNDIIDKENKITDLGLTANNG